MPDPRTALPLCLVALLAAPRAAASDGGPPGIEVRSGRVAAVDWGDRRVTLQGAAGRVDLGFDRNTVVYLPGHLGTMRDVTPGAEVRAAAGPDGTAAWIEIRTAGADGGPAGAPDGGAPGGPGGGPPDAGGAARPDGGAPAAPGGARPGGGTGR